MVCMQNENTVHRSGDDRIGGIFFSRCSKHHMQKIFSVIKVIAWIDVCLLYTSDAADERSSVDLGGRRIIKKKKNVNLGEMSATRYKH